MKQEKYRRCVHLDCFTQWCLLQSENGIDKLLGTLLENVVRNKPDKPVQWMINILANSNDVQQAVQAASQAWGFQLGNISYSCS